MDRRLLLAVSKPNEISLIHIKTNRIIKSWNNKEIKPFFGSDSSNFIREDSQEKNKRCEYFKIKFTFELSNLEDNSEEEINYYTFDPNCIL
jgi:hypothetical protein